MAQILWRQKVMTAVAHDLSRRAAFSHRQRCAAEPLDDAQLSAMVLALAEATQSRAASPSADTPFAVGARAAGHAGYRGGKMDDITVLVAKVLEPSPAKAKL